MDSVGRELEIESGDTLYVPQLFSSSHDLGFIVGSATKPGFVVGPLPPHPRRRTRVMAAAGGRGAAAAPTSMDASEAARRKALQAQQIRASFANLQHPCFSGDPNVFTSLDLYLFLFFFQREESYDLRVVDLLHVPGTPSHVFIAHPEFAAFELRVVDEGLPRRASSARPPSAPSRPTLFASDQAVD